MRRDLLAGGLLGGKPASFRASLPGTRSHVEGFQQGEGIIAHSPIWFSILDFPFSLAVDTALLPITIVQTLVELAGPQPSTPSKESPVEDLDEWTRRAGEVDASARQIDLQ